MFKKLDVKVLFYRLLVLVLLLTLLGVEVRAEGHEGADNVPEHKTLKFATWNIKKLGYSGEFERKPPKLQAIADILSKYDFIVITELMYRTYLRPVLGSKNGCIIKWKDGRIVKLNTDKFHKLKKGETLHPNNFKDEDFEEVELTNVGDSRWDFEEILEILSDRGHNYSCLISPKVGNNFPENYAFLYNEQAISELKSAGLYPDNAIAEDSGKFERDPYWATFGADEFDFSVIVVHIYFGDKQEWAKIKKRREEIMALDEVYDYVQRQNGGENDVLLMGDFNLNPSDVDAFRPLMSLGNMTALFHKDKHVSTIGGYLYDNIFFDANYLTEYIEDTNKDNSLANVECYKLISDHFRLEAEFRDVSDDDKDHEVDGSYIVYYVPLGEEYHTRNCKDITHDSGALKENAIAVVLEELPEDCYERCGVCNPPVLKE